MIYAGFGRVCWGQQILDDTPTDRTPISRQPARLPALRGRKGRKVSGAEGGGCWRIGEGGRLPFDGS